LIEVLPLAVYACDANGAIRWFNRRAAKLWGREPNLNEGRELFCGSAKLFWPDGRTLPHDECPMARALASGAPIDGAEILIERPDGSRIRVVAQIAPLKDADNRTCGAINAFHEIKPSPRDDGEQHARALLDGLPAAIYTTDTAGRITFYNKAAVEFWGRTPELGKDIWCGSWKLFWPDGRPMTHEECPMAVALKEGKAVRGAEGVAERPDGTRVPFIPYPTPLRDASGKMIGAVNMLVDISRRKAAEQRLELLSREVNHRAKNMLAVIQSIVRLSTTPDTRTFSDVLLGRITALGRAHNLLSENRWESAGLQRLIEEELAPFREGDASRVRIVGPRLALAAATAQPLSIVTHELATNAAKYGALSSPAGHVTVEWVRNPDGRVVLRWTESDGPTVRPPTRQNFGLNVIGIVVRSQLGGAAQFDWRPEGLICTIEIPASALAG
jgi:PAS domain S-box-containing protein